MSVSIRNTHNAMKPRTRSGKNLPDSILISSILIDFNFNTETRELAISY